VSKDPKIEKLIETLEASVRYLTDLTPLERDQFLQDGHKIGSAKYHLQTSIESCINIANHLIAANRWRKPAEYQEAFVILGEQGVISTDFVPTMQQMAKMRNRLVHLYWEVSNEQVYDTLQKDLGDFNTFTQYVLSFIEKKEV
jgi:uncharacterized protein YutE (UPF0331/DUF86 family)